MARAHLPLPRRSHVSDAIRCVSRGMQCLARACARCGVVHSADRATRAAVHCALCGTCHAAAAAAQTRASSGSHGPSCWSTPSTRWGGVGVAQAVASREAQGRTAACCTGLHKRHVATQRTMLQRTNADAEARREARLRQRKVAARGATDGRSHGAARNEHKHVACETSLRGVAMRDALLRMAWLAYDRAGDGQVARWGEGCQVLSRAEPSRAMSPSGSDALALLGP